MIMIFLQTVPIDGIISGLLVRNYKQNVDVMQDCFAAGFNFVHM